MTSRALMIPHHQGAIDLARGKLLYGKNPVPRVLAQEIIETRESELAIMRLELREPTDNDLRQQKDGLR